MRKCLLVLGILSTLIVNAQKKTPPKKNLILDPTPAKIGTGEVMDAPRPESELIVDEPFEIFAKNSDKNVIIAYQNFGSRSYALLEYYSKKKVTPFIFERMDRFSNDLSLVRLNGKYGVINIKGKLVVPCIYENMNALKVGSITYYIVSKNGRYGIINGKHETILPFDYENISKPDSADVYVVVNKNGKAGLMNFASRKIVIPIMYDNISFTSSTLVIAKNGALLTLFNIASEKLSPNRYTELNFINNNLAIAELYGKKGLIDMADKNLIPLEYDVLIWVGNNDVSGALFIAAKGGKYGMLGADGKVLMPLQYDMMENVAGDMLIVSKNNKKGVIMEDGKLVMPLEYDEITDGMEYFLVKRDNKYGVAGRDGNFIFPVEFDEMKHMDLEGRYVFSFLKATKNGKKGMVDKTGKVHIDFLYDDLIGVRKISYIAVETFNKFIIAVKNNKYGVIGRNGEEVLPFVYDDLQYMTSYQLIASKNGKYGLIDLNNNNNVLLPFEFQFICYKSGNIIAYKDSYEKYYYDGYKISKMNN